MGKQKLFLHHEILCQMWHTIHFCPTLEATFTRVIEKLFAFSLNVWSYCTSRTIENSSFVIWKTPYSYVAVMRTAFHHFFLPIYLVYYFYYGYFLLTRTIHITVFRLHTFHPLHIYSKAILHTLDFGEILQWKSICFGLSCHSV